MSQHDHDDTDPLAAARGCFLWGPLFGVACWALLAWGLWLAWRMWG